MSKDNQRFDDYSFGIWECQKCGCIYQTKGYDHPDDPGDFNEICCEYYANSKRNWKRHKWKLIECISYAEYRKNGGYGAVNRKKADIQEYASVLEPSDGVIDAGDLVTSALSGGKTRIQRKNNSTNSMKYSKQKAIEVKKIQRKEQAIFAREDKEGIFSEKRELRKGYFSNNGCGCVIFILFIILLIFIILSNSPTKRVTNNVDNNFQTVSTGSVQSNSSSHSLKSNSSKYSLSQITAFRRALFSCGEYAFQGIKRTDVSDISSGGMVINDNGIPYDGRSGVPYGMYLYSSENGGTFIKPTFVGYEVYSYNKPSDILEKNMRKTGSYSCVNFNENTRFPFLRGNNVNYDFTNLYDKSDLKLIRNSIFASHGYIFKSKDMVDFFKKYPWYTPSNNDLDNYTKKEKDNVKFIKKVEDNRE